MHSDFELCLMSVNTVEILIMSLTTQLAHTIMLLSLNVTSVEDASSCCLPEEFLII